MSGVRLNVFSGLRPRVPESLLPENAATEAKNCDFAYGELRSTRAPFLVSTMQHVPASIYTDDGLTFYSWTVDVNAVRSPIVNDQYNRLYYTGDGFKVADRMGTRVNGGPPSSAYMVGVPRPTLAPALSVDAPTVSGANSAFSFKFHYEYGGVKYQEQEISPTVVEAGSKWRFTPPAKNDGGSGAGAEVGGDALQLVTFSNFYSNGVTVDLITYKPSASGSLVRYAFLPGWLAGPVPSSLDSGGEVFWYYLGEGWYSNTVGAPIPSGGQGAVSGGPTPEAAFPVLRITAKSLSDNSPVYDLYPSNSSFPSSGGIFTMTLAKDDGASTYLATVSTGIQEADKVSRAYVFTYVNIYDEEGPGSPVAKITTAPLLTVIASVKKDAAPGYAPIKEIRVYRTPDASEIAEYFFVGSANVLASPDNSYVTFNDDVQGEMLNEPLASMNHYPPAQALKGLMALPNGILCAWKGNELHFSEAYKPWAWPPQYVKPLASAIVGGIPHGAGAIITTTTVPYIVSGVSPDSMTDVKLNVEQAGVSKWSIAVVDGLVIYASNDGLVVINGASGSLVQGQRFFTREVWRSMFPSGMSSMRFAAWDGRLVVYSSTGAFTPFMIRVDEADGTLTELPSHVAQCHFVSQLSDQLYCAQGAGVYQFNGGTELTATWMSRELVIPRPLNYAFAQAVVVGSWTVEFRANGVLRHTKALTTGTTNFRLPAGFTADRWKVRVSGSGRMRELRFAETARELANL